MNTANAIQIWEDIHTERPGFFRAFVCAGPDSDSGSPLVGYCSPGGSFRTVKATAADARKRLPGVPIYRNGRLIPANSATNPPA